MTLPITLEKAEANPTRPLFLEDVTVFVTIKNESAEEVTIERLACSLNVDGGGALSFGSDMMKTVRPGQRTGPVPIRFVSDLRLQSYTNSYTIDVTCSTRGRRFTEHCRPTGPAYFIFQILEPDKHFFLSHRDPSDTRLAESFDHYLKKVQFDGWMAERYNLPGVDIWKDKIPEAMRACVAAIVLWTTDAAAEPTNVLREVKLAKDYGKKVVVVAEHGVALHTDLDKTVEYLRLPHGANGDEVARLVTAIVSTYRKGGYDPSAT